MLKLLTFIRSHLNFALIFVVFIILIMAGYSVYQNHNAPIKIENQHEISVPNVIKKIPMVIKPIKQLKVYNKELLGKKMTLPEEAKIPEAEVSAVGKIKTREGKAIITAVINTETGETKLIAGEKTNLIRPELILSPFVEWRVFGSDSLPIGRIGVNLDVVRILGKGVLYIKGELDENKINSNYKTETGVYVGLRYEIDLLK